MIGLLDQTHDISAENLVAFVKQRRREILINGLRIMLLAHPLVMLLVLELIKN